MNLDFLRHLYQVDPLRHGSGYVSAYLDTSPDEAARVEISLRWRAARDRLAGEGADDPTLDALDQQVSERPPHSPGLALFAREGAVRLAHSLSWRPPDEISRYAPLPDVMPLLDQLASGMPHIRVNASRAGARVLACPADSDGEDITVEGEQQRVHKVSRGGWSEWRLQRSTEETWAANARRIADVAAAAARDVRAAFLVIGGDEWERTAVLNALPEEFRQSSVTVDKEADPDAASFTAAAEAESARRRAAEARARLEDFRARISRTDPNERRAAQGLDDTLAALRAGLADSVLIAYDPSSTRTAWIGPDLADAAVSAAQLQELGIEKPVSDRADAAVARAVCGTGAELYLLPEEEAPPAEGIGALLRAPATAV